MGSAQGGDARTVEQQRVEGGEWGRRGLCVWQCCGLSLSDAALPLAATVPVSVRVRPARAVCAGDVLPLGAVPLHRPCLCVLSMSPSCLCLSTICVCALSMSPSCLCLSAICVCVLPVCPSRLCRCAVCVGVRSPLRALLGLRLCVPATPICIAICIARTWRGGRG